MRRSSSRFSSFPLFLLPFTIICPRLSSIVSYRLLSHVSTVVDMSIPRDHQHTKRLILLCLCILSCLLHATALSFTALDEKTLYFVTWTEPRLYSLDLTRSWNAAKAPLETLPSPPMAPPYETPQALAVNYDKNALLLFSSDRSLSTYNITTKVWQPGTPLPSPPKDSYYGYQVATDPSTGMTYIPSKELNQFVIYSYNTIQGNNPNITMTSMPKAPAMYEVYGVVWSTVRKSLLFYGGVSTIPTTSFTSVLDLMEYQPSNGQWSTVKTQGATTPGQSGGPCMASAYGGMKIVMFGNDKAPWSVFILDVKTLVWTKGADAKPGQERALTGCTVVGDYLIATGGVDPTSKRSPGQLVIVYNIKLNQWTDSYEAPHTPSASTGVGNSATTETSSPVTDQEQSLGGGMPLGAKIGIIAGGSSALVILLSCGAFLLRRRKMHKSGQTDNTEKDLPIPNLESTEGDKNNDKNDKNDNSDNNNNSDNNDNTDDTEKAGDEIQLRDILASLDYLTNRFDQQHGNQVEEAMFNEDEMDELYEDDPNYPPYSCEDMEPYSSSVLDLEYEGGDYDPYEYAYHPPPPMDNNSFPTNAYIPPPLQYLTEQEHQYDSNPYFNKSTLEPSENRQQQPAGLNKSPRNTPSPSPDGQLRLQEARNPQTHSSKPSSSPSFNGHLKPESARNPQHHSSSIPTVAVQQWQCAQKGQDPQYIAPLPSAPTKPAIAYYPQQDAHNDHGGHHDRLDHRAYYHDQRPNNPQEGRDHHNRAMDYSETYHDKRPSGPQVSSGNPNDDDDYLAVYQDPRMNSPEVHGHPSTKKDDTFINNQRRLGPQDHTRHSTASHLEFYQARPYNNPQDHSNQVDQGDDTLYLEIQRIRAQQEQYMLQRQNLERIRLENEAKLRTLADRAKYAQPRGQY